MPPYADLVASPAYISKYAGAAIEVVIADANAPQNVIIGATAGISPAEDYEAVPIEEAGNDGVDEYAQGRMTGAMRIPAFFTPQWNDTLPTRQSFVGKRYIITERIAPGRPQAGTILNVYVQCTLRTLNSQMGARGAKTLDLEFAYTRRYNGSEWAALTGG